MMHTRITNAGLCLSEVETSSASQALRNAQRLQRVCGSNTAAGTTSSAFESDQAEDSGLRERG